jgi:solute carrier family 25 protein 39/40
VLMVYFPVTPFDVVKTRLQTQLPEVKSLSSSAPFHAPSLAANARHLSTLSGSIPQHLVNAYVLDHSIIKAERGSGFADAIKHVVRAEGVRGLWKGVGTSM